ncbi:30S ribosomal protein S18 [Candidatus Curtissbacteria bacterium]|nr:30S ribosomal protein S18 [Candidatus Curtissbacteria bacterium]
MPIITRRRRIRKCPVCEEGATIDYKDTVYLRKFTSERGKILGRAKTGVCAKHQRQLTRSVKRARFLALIPFVQR